MSSRYHSSNVKKTKFDLYNQITNFEKHPSVLVEKTSQLERLAIGSMENFSEDKANKSIL